MPTGTFLETLTGNRAYGASGEYRQTEERAALLHARNFLQVYWARMMAISAVLLIPCLWHRTVFASDLGSHLYNAWLAHLIARSQAPGLWLAPQWTNVLFDWMLTAFQSFLGFGATEKLAVSIAVLIFFWGLFTLACASSREIRWYLAPFIALLSYGYTFQMGFFNYYLSLGLAFFALAVLWRGAWKEKLLALALCPLIAIAHPFGLLWLAGAAAYIGVVEMAPGLAKLLVLPLAAGVIFFIHHYFWHHFIVEAEPEHWYGFTGADQLRLFGDLYLIPEFLLIAFVLAAVASDLIRRLQKGEAIANLLLPLQLYIVAELAVFLFPRGVTFAGRVPIALITERLTTISAAMACLVLAAIRPRAWHLTGLLAISALFFALLYRDTGTVNRMELQAEHLVKTLPRGSRVVATIEPPPHAHILVQELARALPEVANVLDSIEPSFYSRILVQHLIDRACVGHCFDYGNYEPASAVFRVRATDGNPYVLSDYGSAIDTEFGTYEVQPEDLPLYQVFQCSANGLDLCIRPLQAGEVNDRTGVHADDE